MKKGFILSGIFMFLMAGFIYADIITVNNAASSTAMYKNLQQAIDSAEIGDTIMVSSSASTYGDITIKKKVVLIGGGFQVGDRSLIQQVRFTNSGGICNGTVFKGFYFHYRDFNFDDHNQMVHNVLIERCYFERQFRLYGSNAIISSSVMRNNLFLYGSNVTVMNSIVSPVRESTSYSNTIQNCLFIGVDEFNSFYATSALTIQNCIFYNSACTSTAVKFMNCLTTGEFVFPNQPFNTDNLVIDLETDSLFVDAPNNTAFDFTAYYHLDDESPAKGAGLAGVDMGVYGGDLPFSDHMAPAIPKIIYLNSYNSIVPKDGVLKVNVKAVSVK